MEINEEGFKEVLTSTCQVSNCKKHWNNGSTSKPWTQIKKENKKTVINSNRTRAKKAKAKAEYAGANKRLKKSMRIEK